jgi:hypothetical protein
MPCSDLCDFATSLFFLIFNGRKEAQEAQDGVIVLCFLCLFVAIKMVDFRHRKQRGTKPFLFNLSHTPSATSGHTVSEDAGKQPNGLQSG